MVIFHNFFFFLWLKLLLIFWKYFDIILNVKSSPTEKKNYCNWIVEDCVNRLAMCQAVKKLGSVFHIRKGNTQRSTLCLIKKIEEMVKLFERSENGLTFSVQNRWFYE